MIIINSFLQHHCVVPSKPRLVLALSFSPSSPSLLLLVFSNHQVDLYDVESKQFPDWAQELCSSLPQRFTQLHDHVLGVTFNPPNNGIGGGGVVVSSNSTNVSVAESRDAYFWGSTWLCKVTLDAPVGWGGFAKKRRRVDDNRKKYQGRAPHAHSGDGTANAEDTEPTNFKVVSKYRPVLFADFLATDELVIVERPLVDVLATLPPAFFKVKYGT